MANGEWQIKKKAINVQAVPVRPKPNISTFIGTVRRQFLLLTSVSLVKISVIGFLVYFAENAMFSTNRVCRDRYLCKKWY